jgi:hypothetical protein
MQSNAGAVAERARKISIKKSGMMCKYYNNHSINAYVSVHR